MKSTKPYLNLFLLVLMPLQIVIPRDSAETTYRIAIGSGQYVDAVDRIGYSVYGVGCNDGFGYGNSERSIYDETPHQTTVKEISMAIEHKPAASDKFLGIQGHFNTRPGAATNYLINPFVGVESKTAAVQAGILVASNGIPSQNNRLLFKRIAPSIFLRIGPPRFYMSASYLSEIPITANGYFQLGFGSGLLPYNKMACWVGLSDGPFKGFGFTTKLGLQITPSIALHGAIRRGSATGNSYTPETGSSRWEIPETTVSAGLSFRHQH